MKEVVIGGKTVEVSDEQYAQLLDEVRKEIKDYQDLVGEKWLFRTVTYHCVGEVKKIVGRFAHLKTASWVADSGKFSIAIKDGILSEVEFVGEMFVNLDTVVDFFPWVHSLPKSSK